MCAVPPNALCVVIDVQPAERGAPPTFRFPDRDVRTIFELQERCLPGALFSSTHFCGLPRLVTLGFRLVRPFMRKEAYEAMVLKPSFAHLAQHIDASARLPRWGGTLDFDGAARPRAHAAPPLASRRACAAAPLTPRACAPRASWQSTSTWSGGRVRRDPANAWQ